MSPNCFLSLQTLPFFSETISREERQESLFLQVKLYFAKMREKGISQEGFIYQTDSKSNSPCNKQQMLIKLSDRIP